MSNDFKWRTEDDSSWEDGGEERPFSQEPTLLSRLKKRRRWLGLAAVFLIIVGFVVYSLFNRQVEKVEDANTNGVLAVHALVRQAGLKRDFDLLDVLVLDSGSNWAKSQLYLLNVDLFLDRRPFGLEIASEDPPAQGDAITVTLSSDLQTAELIEHIPYRLMPYQIGDGQQLSETVWLEHAFNYQQQEGSWLLAPLPEDVAFWGEWENAEFGDWLTLIHSERDADIADYLGQRLNALIGQICGDDDMACPPGFKVELRLIRNLHSLTVLNDNIGNITLALNNVGLYHLSLPSPTLVGRPVDEAGYQALYRGYASWLAAVITTRFTGDPLVTEQVVEGKLTTWGLPMPPEPQQVLPRSQPLSPPPIPFPEQDILLVCTDITKMTLLRFNPRANQWSDELRGHETIYLSPQTNTFSGSLMASLPDDSGALINVSSFSGESPESKIVVWQDGEAYLLATIDFTIHSLAEALLWQFDPGGRNIVFFAYLDAFTENGQEEQIAPYVLNLEECLSGNCEPQFYDGLPYWSPDLAWVLLVDLRTMSQLTLRNEGSGEEISFGDGYSPNWIDDESFIYIRTVEQPEGTVPLTQIVAATIDDPLNGRILFDSSDISAVLDPDAPSVLTWIRAVFAHPTQPDWLFIVAISDPSENPFDQYILSFDSETGQLYQIMELGSDLLAYPFQIVQNGRLLDVKTTGTSGMRTVIPLNPAEKTIGEAVTFRDNLSFGEDWSQDGRWLLIAEQGYLSLFAPDHAYYETINYDGISCTEAVWINAPD